MNSLRRDCDLAAKFWGRTFSGLGAVTYREKGEAAIKELWVKLLGQHQEGFYEQGLGKLGIPPDTPPAVAAAQYHYLTNLIGGLTMEYVEESPKKVWIRYTAPMWTYDGVAMMALPSRLRRTIFAGWHPHNGRMMGCPRLGWVATKFIMEGEPYDEGYFIEYDRDLEPGEELRYELAGTTPEFDPAKAPKLDTGLWPEARQLKARRNWSREYVRTTTDCLLQMFGEQTTSSLLHQTMRGLAIQYTHELRHDLGIAECDLQGVIGLFEGLLSACDQDFTSKAQSATTHRIVLRSFKPYDDGMATEAVRAAVFQFFEMAVRLMNGRISVRRRPEPILPPVDYEVWDLEDTGRWLW